MSVSLPGVAPVALTAATVNFKAGTANATDGDASCTGTANNPTAPPGKVCLYVGSAAGFTQMAGGVWMLPKRGFFVQWVPTGNVGADILLEMTWAYTAP